MSWAEKTEEIKQRLRARGSLLVALSGGVDSAVVAALAAAALGDRALAVTVNSPLVGSTELEDAKKVAGDTGIKHMIVELDELEIPGFAQNPAGRCYLCKQFRFGRLKEMARELGYREVADGTTASDLDEYRPGMRAAEELAIYHPLVEAGLTKSDTAGLARYLKLPVTGKAHNSCLATRIPYGEGLTPARLQRIDEAENYLRGLLPGVQLRVRDHGDLARLETGPEAVPRFLDRETGSRITRQLRELGYRFVTLDLDGYRFGSYDE